MTIVGEETINTVSEKRSILRYMCGKFVLTESRKSLKKRDEVEIFLFPRFCYTLHTRVLHRIFWTMSIKIN